MEFPTKKYSIIYADPPWDYENWNKAWHLKHKESRWAGKKYPLMATEEICKLPIKEISNPNAVLFIWSISTMIPNALRVIESWGFKYKTIAFVWIKKNTRKDTLFTGMGFWTRANAEICLLATRGKPLPRISRKVHSVIVSPRRTHSQKPDEARERIVELLGDIPRIELFARDKVDGWDSWGNEIE